MYKNILIATDGSSLAARAVEHGVSLAKTLGANVLLLTVTERFHVFALVTSVNECKFGCGLRWPLVSSPVG